ncbi:MAG: hypothetical protein HY763_17045 [Planctomycetes bacterium]|nr:hypothetical protein [Planctomycetota bacterium]
MTKAHPSTRAASPRPSLDASLAAGLSGIAARLRRYVLLEGLAFVVGFLWCGSLLQLALDYTARGLQWSMRLALLLAMAGGGALLLWRRLLSPLRVPAGPAEIAHLLERRHPQLSSILVSAVRFASGEVGEAGSNSHALMASVIRRAGAAARAADFEGVLNGRRARRSAAALIGTVALFLAAAVLAPEIVGLWFSRNVLLQEIEWPKQTRLLVETKEGVLFGARGDDLVVHATAEGVQPREVEILFETASGRSGRETMVTVGNPGSYRYRYTFKNPQEDLVFSLRGGDDRTREHSVRLLDRPRVTESRVELTPPGYTRLPVTTLGDGQRAAQVLPGTRVAIRIKTNKPVVRATLMAGETAIADAAEDGEARLVAVVPLGTTTYHFALLDDVGLEDKQPAKFSFRVIKDDPPGARMKMPGVGELITPEAVLPFELEYADTYGLATAELAFEVSTGSVAEKLIPLPEFEAGTTTFSTSLQWPVSAEGIVAGVRLTLRARAADFDDVSGPNLGQSPAVTLRVVTRDEFLAEIARREQEARMDFERLVDAQDQLRGALLSVLNDYRRDIDTAALAAALAPLERRQRSLAGSVNVTRQTFERLLEELRINQLDSSDERERLGVQIVEPLTQLAKRDMVTAADTLRQWAREGSAELAARVDAQQETVLSQMRSVLAAMIQWEGYHEVVNMLRDIVRLQTELHSETKEALQKEAGNVFDD